MTQEQRAITEFMLRVGQKCPIRPQMIDGQTAILRRDLIREELAELWESHMSGDLVGVSDAIGDLLYVVLGAAVAYGIDLEPIFWEIHRSNMSKFIDGHMRPDGKWIKGPSYSPANLTPILNAQS
jgi:predicted HAD superfamily Cof-like phosphohydrolase